MNLLKEFKPERSGFFRHRQVAGGYLLTGDAGDFAFLSAAEFGKFIAGGIKPGTPLHARLAAGGFLGAADAGVLSRKWLAKNNFIFSGPTLHIIVLTRRCNYSCSYCQAGTSAGAAGDMSRKTAAMVLDTVFSSPAPALTIEFQGGEPLLNWPVLSYIVKEAAARAEKSGKKVVLSLVTNMSLMTRARLDFLVKYKVRLCTSLDGPKAIHNRNRPCSGGDSHENAVKWLKEIKKSSVPGASSGDALLTVTRASLPLWKEIVDQYIRLGMSGIFIRFLNPFGSAKRVWGSIGYSSAEYLDFYRKSLDYVIDLNLAGKSRMIEHSARILLAKIYGAADPNYLDLRSPCGAGIGQIAYDHDGRVFTCDEGRMLAAMGDDAFCMGKVGKDKYPALISSPAVKCAVTASVTDIQVSCSSCAYKPYCGVCPVYNYAEHGDLFMHQPSYRCEIYMGMLDHIFTRAKSKPVERLFRSWADSRPV